MSLTGCWSTSNDICFAGQSISDCWRAGTLRFISKHRFERNAWAIDFGKYNLLFVLILQKMTYTFAASIQQITNEILASHSNMDWAALHWIYWMPFGDDKEHPWMDRIAKEAHRVHRHPHRVTGEWGKEYFIKFSNSYVLTLTNMASNSHSEIYWFNWLITLCIYFIILHAN